MFERLIAENTARRQQKQPYYSISLLKLENAGFSSPASQSGRLEVITRLKPDAGELAGLLGGQIPGVSIDRVGDKEELWSEAGI
jgi:hypothetical protein